MRRLFEKTVNIWEMDQEQRANLIPGQWVTAGKDGPRGRFMGDTGRSTVVAWHGNARGSGDYWGYMKNLYEYARRNV